MAGTRWVRLDVEYFTNAKTMSVTPTAQVLHLASICWSATQLTDGHLPPDAVAMLLRVTRARRSHVAELCRVHLWHPLEDGWIIHDYLAMQDSRARVEQKRKLATERLAKWKAEHGR